MASGGSSPPAAPPPDRSDCTLRRLTPQSAVRTSSSRLGEEEAAGEVAAAGAGDSDLGAAGDLPGAGLAPQLGAGLVEEAVAVEAAGGQLAAVGVERRLAVAGD